MVSNTKVANGLKRPRDMYEYTYSKPLPGYVTSDGNQRPIVEWALLETLSNQGFEFDIDRDNKSVVDPQQVYDALARYQDDVNLTHRPELDVAVAMAYDVFGRNGREYLSPLSSKLDYMGAVRMDKSSSAPEFQSKADAFEKDYRRLQYYLRGRTYHMPPCVAYTRVQHGASGPKTRLVWGYPLSVTLLEATYARPLIERFLHMRTPMAFGLHRQDLVCRMQRIRNSELRVSLDFSKFDSSIKPYLIRTAFRILRTWFPRTLEVGLRFKAIEDYFIHTPILMPDGDVYKKHQGVPSGSYFTQIVDSIVNFIAMEYLHIRMNGSSVNPDKVLVLGDDSIMCWYTDCDLDAMAEVLKELRMTVNVEKSVFSRRNEPVHFLGHTIKRAFPQRDLQELAVRLVFPERFSGIDDPAVRRFTRTLALYGDAIEGAELLERAGYSYRDLLFGLRHADFNSMSSGWIDHQRATDSFVRPRSTLSFAATSCFI